MNSSKWKNCSKYFPVNSSGALRDGLFGDISKEELKRWNIFKGALTRTPWMVDFLYRKQLGRCPICETPIDLRKAVIHHTNYQQFCIFSTTSESLSPTARNPTRKVKIANCDKCSNINNCVDKIVLIHQACHIYLHIKEGRIKKKRSDPNQEEFKF